MKSIALAAASCAALLAAMPPAHAQQEASETEAPSVRDMDTVIVFGRRNPEDPPVVALARQRLSETPGAVSVISQESYARRAALALDDMLRDAPGVYAQRKWGGDIRISIRGSGIGNANHNRGVLIAQDGVPLNEADGFGDSQIADPLLTRFTEVRRGGNALRFGGAMLGGAINMVTPTGADAGFRNRVRVDGGSFGLARINVQAARQAGAWDAFAAGTLQRADGARPQNAQDLRFASLNIGRNFGAEREIRLIVNAADIVQEIPGALTWAQFRADPRQAAPANAANDYRRDQQSLRGSLRANWRLTDALFLEAAAYAVWKHLDHPIFQVIEQQSRNHGGFARLNWQGEVAGMRADGFAGAWLRAGDLDSHFHTNLRGEHGPLQSVSYQNADAVDVFAEGRLFVTRRLALTGGGSWGRAGRDYRSTALPDRPATFDLVRSRTYEWLAPRVGVLWEEADGTQVFANLTKSVEPPNFGALSPSNTGFAPVRAQEAWTMEAGARGRSGPFIWDIALYRARLDGELLQYTLSPSIPATTFNAERTIHQGVEAALDWRFAEDWRLRQTWTWSDFRFLDDAQYGDNRLPVAPEHFYRAELRYEHPSGWFAAPSVEWSASDIWVDYSNTTRAPSYAVLSLNAGWAFDNGVTLFVDARNLTDRAYVSNVQAAILAGPATAAYWPGDRFSVFAGLTANF